MADLVVKRETLEGHQTANLDRIVEVGQVGGLHHRYERIAA